jgi:hypothetical protein
VRRTVKNRRFAEYILQSIDEASDGNDWRFRQCQNLKWMPVDMEEFLLGEEYMNAEAFLYPAVIDELIEMNAGGYTEVLLTGGIGSAKTTCALYTTAYQLYLLSCYKQPHRQFALDPHSEIMIVFQSITQAKAKAVGYDRFKSMIETSPYFRANFPHDPNMKSSLIFPNRIEVRPISGQQFASIGENVIGGLIDELNYMDVTEKSKRTIDGGTYDQAVAVYNSIARRRKSRFHQLGELPGLLCLVSSRRYPGQFTDGKEKEAETDKTIYVYDKRVWDIKPEGTFTSGFFTVFIGDQTRKPRVMKAEEKLPEKDQHLIDHIPNEYKPEFETDIFDALREIGGKSTLARHPFLANRERVEHCFGRRQSIFGSDWVDFEDTQLSFNPRRFTDLHEPRFAHVDLGLTNDSAGVAIGYVPEFIENDRGEMLHQINIDGVLEVRPPRGGEIKFWKIRDLFYKLRENGLNIQWITFDTYQSVDSLQLLHNQGFTTGNASMDKTRAPYEFLKTALYDGRIALPTHSHLLTELVSLEDVPAKGKIDHPPRGSKDCADALAGVVYGLVRQRLIYVRHDVPMNMIPAQVQQLLQRNQTMREAEDRNIEQTREIINA